MLRTMVFCVFHDYDVLVNNMNPKFYAKKIITMYNLCDNQLFRYCDTLQYQTLNQCSITVELWKQCGLLSQFVVGNTSRLTMHNGSSTMELLRRCLLLFKALNYQYNYGRRNAHISYIEYACTQRANANIHKISNMPVVHKPVNNIARTAGKY